MAKTYEQDGRGWAHRLLGPSLADLGSALVTMALGLVLLGTTSPDARAQAVDVSSSGMPGYSYPIGVPPGIAGMVPNVGLAYTGGGVNGPLGYGWSLQGISTVTRCPYTRAIDGVTRGVAYDGSDKLCIDGQRLIQVDPSTGAVVNGGNTNPNTTNPFQQNDALGLSSGFREYRTEKDTFSRIRAYGVAGGAANGPSYFIVWTKGGQIYEYGNFSNASARALILAQGRTAAAAWAVSRIRDTLGNYIDFQYEQRDTAWGSSTSLNGAPAANVGHEWNLSEIRYTGTAGGTLPQNRVSFVYEDRPGLSDGSAIQDRAETYHLGSKNVSVRRLKQVLTQINIQGQPVTVKTLNLSYVNGSRSQRSLLQKIQDCAGTSTTRCMPATTFSYSAGGDDSYVASANLRSLATTSLQDANTGVLTGDFNGDGKTDLLVWSTTPANNKLYLSSGDGGFTQVATATLGLSTKQLFSSNGCYLSTLADINGDGLADIVRYSGPKDLNGNNCSSYGSTEIYLANANGDGGFTTKAYSGPTLERAISYGQDNCPNARNPTTGFCTDDPPNTKPWSRGANFYLFDVDGDGRPDLMTSVLPAYPVSALPNHDPCLDQICTRVYKGSGDGTFTQELTTNLAHVTVYVPPKPGTGFGAPSNLLDADGDGLVDLNGLASTVPPTTSASRWQGLTPLFNATGAYRSRGDGSFDAASTQFPCAYSLDFNGDGRSDCLYLPAGSSTGQLWLFAGGNSIRTVTNFNMASVVLSDLTHSMTALDINADGRQDILRLANDPTQTQLYLSNGDGTFSLSSSFNLNNGIRQLRKSDGSSDFVVGDFTGHGGTEFLRLKSAPSSSGGESTQNTLYLKTDSTPPDLLQMVTSGTGLKTTLSWVSMGNSTLGTLGARYISDRGTSNQAIYPKIDLMAPMYVVAKLSADTGVGSSQTVTEYRYAGFKAAYDSRGGQGFREFRRQAPTPDGKAKLITATQFLQDFPYTGVASVSSSWLGGLNDTLPASPLSRSSYSYCNAANPSAQVAASPTAATVPCSVPAGTYLHRPYLYQSLESGQDLSGIALPTVKTTNVFNNWGDPTSIEVVNTGTSVGQTQTVTRTTTNQYDTPVTSCTSDTDCRWILGRLLQGSQRNQVPQLGLGATAGTALFATATSGSSVLPQLSFSPASVSFGNKLVGSSYVSAAVTLTNPGGVLATGLNFSVPSGFAMTANNCSSTLAGGASCSFTVTWTPSLAQAYSGTLSVGSSNATVNNSLSLSGTAFQPPTLSSVALSASTITLASSAQLRWTAGGGAVSSSASCSTGLSGSGSSNPLTVTAAALGAGSCTVTATNGMGTQTTAQVSATVVAAATISNPSYTNAVVTTGNTNSLQWTIGGGATASSAACSGAATGSGTSSPMTVGTTGTGTGSCTITATNAAGTPVTSTVTFSVVAAPTVASASFNAANVTTGNTNSLSWTLGGGATSGSASCSGAATGSGTTSPLSVGTTGTGTGTCVVTATNAAGTQITTSRTFTVVAAPTVASAAFSTANVTTGGTNSLTWTLGGGATSGSVSCSGAATGSGTSSPTAVGTTGTGTGTCVVTATNAAGTQATTSRTFTVVAAPTVASASFSAANVTTGNTNSLTWSLGGGATSGSASCSGAATGSGTTSPLTVGTTGTGTGSCVVTATNAAGSQTTSTVTFAVVAAPSVASASFAAANVTTGGTNSLSWTLGGGATSGSVSCSGAATGSGTSSPTTAGTTGTGTGTCTVTATNAAGTQVTTSRTFTVVAAPTVASASFSAANVTTGNTNLLSWSVGGGATGGSVSCSGAATGSGTSSPLTVGTTGTGTGSCVVTATNAAGSQTTGSVSFNVVAAPSVTSASMGAAYVTAGNTTGFSWSASNATATSASCSGTLSGSGSGSSTGGSLTATAGASAGTGTCTATATNAAGTSAQASASTSVVLAPAMNGQGAAFYPNNTIAMGSTVTFSWALLNASYVNVACGSGATGSLSSGPVTGDLTVTGSSVSSSAYCTVTGYNAAGASVSKTVPLTVVPAGTTLTPTPNSGSASLAANGSVVQTFSIQNTGASAATSLVINATTNSGTGWFSIYSGGTCTSGGSLAVGASCTVKVKLQAGCPAAGTTNGQLSVASSAGGTPAVVSLSVSNTKGACF